MIPRWVRVTVTTPVYTGLAKTAAVRASQASAGPNATLETAFVGKIRPKGTQTRHSCARMGPSASIRFVTVPLLTKL